MNSSLRTPNENGLNYMLVDKTHRPTLVPFGTGCWVAKVPSEEVRVGDFVLTTSGGRRTLQEVLRISRGCAYLTDATWYGGRLFRVMRASYRGRDLNLRERRGTEGWWTRMLGEFLC